MRIDFLLFLMRYHPASMLILMLATIKFKLNIELTYKQYYFLRCWEVAKTLNARLYNSKNSVIVSSNYENSNVDFCIRKYPSSDFNVFDQVITNQEYLPLVRSIKEVFSNDQVIILDVGANVGFTALFLKKHLPNSQIFCVEPSITNSNQLEINLKKNGLHDIKIFKGALWYRNERLELVNDFRDKRDWSTRVQRSDEGSTQGLTLSELLNHFSLDTVDVLKIDIEGAEEYLFKDELCAKEILQKCRILAVEIHDEYNIRSMIQQKFEEYKYEYFNSGELTIAIKQG